MLRGLFAAVALFFANPADDALAADTPATEVTAEGRPIHQLRVYEIFEGNKVAFHARFRDHAQRMMARHGFHILSTWETKAEGRTEFVYLLQWRDEAQMKAAWAAFMADPEWAGIKRVSAVEHGRLVGEIEDRILAATNYSRPLE